MTKCPECNEEIDHLNHFQSGESKSRMEVVELQDMTRKKVATYEEIEFQPDNKINEYECPRCGKVLFADETKAVDFLAGE